MNTIITLQNHDIHTGNLILVNQTHGLREEVFFHGRPEKTLIPVCDSAPGILLQRTAVTLLSELMRHIQGWNQIVPVSGWRSFQEQQDIWDGTLQKSGPEFTQKYVAVPGHSEHQTGLAIDLGLRQEHIDFICPEFPYSGICQTFRNQAAKYGFILRYPAGKEQITGIGHEPWHFRYVGVPHAEIMVKHNLTLEEYIGFIKDFSYENRPYILERGEQNILVSYVKAEGTGDNRSSSSGSVTIEFSDVHPYTVSGNNADGFILTEWRQKNAKARNLRRA